MQVKTFTAKSMAEALAQIKTDLGPDAVILDSKSAKGKGVTVTAALERAVAPASECSAPAGDVWQKEWSSIKTHLLHLMRPSLRLDQLPARQRTAMEYLQGEGLCEEAVLALYEKLRANPDESILGPLSEVVKVKAWSAGSWPQKFHVLAGPFGSGKTTVAVRMALMLRKKNPDMRICLINADATRGNGRLLLKHYADLSDFAYKEAGSTMELVAALTAAENEGFERIIVDLPGLPKNRYLTALIKDAGLDKRDAAAHLVLPPHYGQSAFNAILERYRTSLPGSIVWTKLDEAEQYGQIVSAGLKTGLPVSALSYGPSLGNSLCPAVEVMLWRMLFKHELPGQEFDTSRAGGPVGMAAESRTAKKQYREEHNVNTFRTAPKLDRAEKLSWSCA